MKKSGSSPFKKNTNGQKNRKPSDKKPFSRKRYDKPSGKYSHEKEGSSVPSAKSFENNYSGSEKKYSKTSGYKNKTTKPYRKEEKDGPDRPIERYIHKKSREDKKPYFDKPYPSREKKFEGKSTYSDKKFPSKNNYKKRTTRPYRKEEGVADRPIERYTHKRSSEDKTSYTDKQHFLHNGENENTHFSNKKRPRKTEQKTYIPRKHEYHNTEIFVQDNTYAPRRSQNNKLGEKGIRLNKYIANAGVCSRREADKLIESGAITVNGKIVTQLGIKIKQGDVVNFGGQILSGEPLQYLLLNKPKGYLTTTDDPQERQTVMEIIKDACKERIYPVGRLDKNTSGLLLFTNDGELAKRLTHPKHRVEKVYKAVLDKPLLYEDLKKIIAGIELEDGFIKVDDIAYGETKKEIGLELHSGRNRIVRRIFESLGYEVIKLDRVVFAGLTKKDLPRGKYRFLSNEEVNILRRIT